MRRTTSLPPPSVSLRQWVFAGCGTSLLGNGPSRRYLRKSFLGCLAPYPGCPSGARARFFPLGVGLPQCLNGSARGALSRKTTSCGRLFSGLQTISLCSGLRVCSPSRSFQPWGMSSTPGRHGFYVHAYLGLLPPRAVDMLTVRIEQLTVEGLTPSKICGLAGRS